MYCLWNGEYGEHEVFTQSVDGNLKTMEEAYKKNVGVVVGDFTCLKVEYDWGRRDQRWTIQCNRCGKISYQYHTSDWRRGKGRSVVCQCRKEEKEREKIEKKEKSAMERKKISEIKKEHIGKIYGEWEVTDVISGKYCKIKCTVCGLTKGTSKKIPLEDLINGNIEPCNHKKPNDYSGEEWIGKRNGHLVTIGRDGGLFIVKCDCGQTTTARGVDLFTRKAKKSCGLVGCNFSTDFHKESIARRKAGEAYEKECLDMLISKGYDANATKFSGDYGVDIIITNSDGSLTAVQCKHQNDPVGVGAIQEVYAGGRFYDCTKFSVISTAEFSDNAINMARKLGVYLCNGEYSPPENLDQYANELIPVYKPIHFNAKLYEVNGELDTLANWCYRYGTTEYYVKKHMASGLSLENALLKKRREKETFTVGDFTGTLKEICNHYGVRDQTVRYRMKHMGLSLKEAISRGGKN